MTDVPRRSYPLVVPPPGGFEEAVRRGRSIRRRRTGGGSAVALVFVGALAYSMVGSGNGTSSLGPASRPTSERTAPAAGASQTPSPEATPTGTTPDTGSNTVAGPRGGGPMASQTPGSYVQPPAGPGQPGPVYAPRSPIDGPRPLDPGSNPDCLASTAGREWCATARVDRPTTTADYYVLTYTLCRYATSGGATLDFKRAQEVDFSVTHVATDDTVWTYSKGVPVTSANKTETVDGGYCVQWSVHWDGYDDFHRLPPSGQYTLTVRSLSVQTVPDGAIDFTW